jgi:hypothetical protein
MCRKLVYLMAFVMMLGVVGSVSADSLVAHWKLDEGSGTIAYDSAGSNNGTLYNGPIWGQPDCVELWSWLTFDGSDDYVRVPDNASMDFGANPFSIAFWMKHDGSHGGEIIINGTSGPAPRSGKRYEVILSGGALYFTIDDDASAKIQIATAYPTDLEWHHIVCRRIVLDPGPGQGLDIWIDSERKGAGGAHNPARNIDSPGEDLYIGTCTDGIITRFPGRLGDIRLYDYAISEADILAMASYESLVAWCADPDDDAANVSVNTNLSWNIPTDANELTEKYKVYFSTSSTFAGVTPVVAGPLPAGEDRASVSNAQIGGPLAMNTTYYWRVDCYDPNTATVTRTGNVWSFGASLTLPTLVSPPDAYTPTVDVDVNLVWSSDPLAASHNVVITPDGESPVTLVNKTSPFNPYADPGITMTWNKKYLWQVKELDSGGIVRATGPEWKFQVRALNCNDPAPLVADFDDNCIVNLADFAVMSSEWLDCNWDDGGKASPCP